MSDLFEIKEHVVEAQHVRDYPRATAHSQNEILYTSVKQYIPKNNPNPQPGDVTILGAHANGFVKVCRPPIGCIYESLDSNDYPRSYMSRYGKTSSKNLGRAASE
jgi:hypothetical protein